MKQYKEFYVDDAISQLVAPNTLKKTIPFTLYSGGVGTQQSYELTNDNIKFSLEKYYNYAMVDKLGIDNAYGVLKHLWDGFISKNMDNLSRTLTALMSEYNPLENVERHGDITEAHSGNDTYTKGTKVITTYNESNGMTDTRSTRIQHGNTSVTTQYGETTQTNSSSAFDTNNFSDTDKSKVNQHSDTTTGTSYTDSTTNSGGTSATHTGTVTDASSGSDTTQHGEKIVTTDTMHGNIGTTMTQDMINKELSLRKYNFTDIVVNQFVIKHLRFYVDLY